jgi:hypothetical protein
MLPWTAAAKTAIISGSQSVAPPAGAATAGVPSGTGEPAVTAERVASIDRARTCN